VATFKEDLLTVARAAWAISCDDYAYDHKIRENASELWFLAMDLLNNHERLRGDSDFERLPSALRS
jgi:hypothetical protein